MRVPSSGRLVFQYQLVDNIFKAGYFTHYHSYMVTRVVAPRRSHQDARAISG